MTKEIDDWMAAYNNPMKAVVESVRQAVLAADPRMEECIKWHAPTFTYKGNLARFFPKAKAHATLMFHKGANIPGDFPNLVGDGKEARKMTFADLDDVGRKQEELRAIVQAWCDWKDS